MRTGIALIGLCLALAGCTEPQAAAENSTTELMLDTMGTKGFAVKRTIHGRNVNSPDAVIVARNHLVAQSGLCPNGFAVESFSLAHQPPVLTYEAKIRCT